MEGLIDATAASGGESCVFRYLCSANLRNAYPFFLAVGEGNETASDLCGSDSDIISVKSELSKRSFSFNRFQTLPFSGKILVRYIDYSKSGDEKHPN